MVIARVNPHCILIKFIDQLLNWVSGCKCTSALLTFFCEPMTSGHDTLWFHCQRYKMNKRVTLLLALRIFLSRGRGSPSFWLQAWSLFQSIIIFLNQGPAHLIPDAGHCTTVRVWCSIYGNLHFIDKIIWPAQVAEHSWLQLLVAIPGFSCFGSRAYFCFYKQAKLSSNSTTIYFTESMTTLSPTSHGWLPNMKTRFENIVAAVFLNKRETTVRSPVNPTQIWAKFAWKAAAGTKKKKITWIIM